MRLVEPPPDAVALLGGAHGERLAAARPLIGRARAVTGTRIRLRHGATWTVITVIYLALGGFCGVLVVNYATNEQPLLAVAGAAAAALGAVAIALLFLAGARRAPTLTVERDGLVIDLPGVLREPLLMPRQQVVHVYMRDAYDIRDDRPRGFGLFRRPEVPAGTRRVAWLSFGDLTGPSEWRLLIVVDPPIAFKRLVRRTTGVRHAASVVVRVFSFLPSYGTVARGLACEPERLQDAVDALFAAGYPVTRPPVSPEHVAWLRDAG